RPRARARRAHRPSRRHHRVRSAAHPPSSRCDACPHRPDCRHCDPARRREGDGERKNGIYPPGRKPGVVPQRGPATPVERAALMVDQELTEAARALLDLCRGKRLMLAAAESCTGGLLAATLTEIPGSSDVFERGFVTYSNEAKRVMLGVTPMTLAE